MFALVLCCFFSFLFTQNGGLQSCYIFLYLFHFEVAGSQAEGHKKGNFSYRQENFVLCFLGGFFGLKLYEIPSELICFQIQKNLCKRQTS